MKPQLNLLDGIGVIWHVIDAAETRICSESLASGSMLGHRTPALLVECIERACYAAFCQFLRQQDCRYLNPASTRAVCPSVQVLLGAAVPDDGRGPGRSLQRQRRAGQPRRAGIQNPKS